MWLVLRAQKAEHFQHVTPTPKYFTLSSCFSLFQGSELQTNQTHFSPLGSRLRYRIPHLRE